MSASTRLYPWPQAVSPAAKQRPCYSTYLLGLLLENQGKWAKRILCNLLKWTLVSLWSSFWMQCSIRELFLISSIVMARYLQCQWIWSSPGLRYASAWGPNPRLLPARGLRMWTPAQVKATVPRLISMAWEQAGSHSNFHCSLKTENAQHPPLEPRDSNGSCETAWKNPSHGSQLCWDELPITQHTRDHTELREKWN